MRSLVFSLVLGFSGLVAAQTPVKADQGRPGNQGPWPVTGTFFLADGGVIKVIQGPGQDGGAWNVSVNNFPHSFVATGPDGGAVVVQGTVTVVGPDGGAVLIQGPVDQGKSRDGGTNWPVEPNLPALSTANLSGACPSGAANFTVAAAYASRKWIYIWGDPSNTDDVFVKLGVTATSANARLAPGQALNIDSSAIYTGQIDAFPASGTQGVCRVEL